MKAILPYRVIFDFGGIKSLYAKYGKDAFSIILYRLIFINDNSLQHKRNHIITSNKSFGFIKENLLEKVEPQHYSWLSAAIRPQQDEKLESIASEQKRIWEYAILVSSDSPHQTIIFTDEANKASYEGYKLADKKDNILIITDESSMKERIDAFFNICREFKQN